MHGVPSLRGVADLARSGGEGVSSPFARVRYEIHQHDDKPGIYRRLLSRDPRGLLGPFNYSETLTFAANGVGLIVGTSLETAATGQGLGEVPAASVFLAEDEPTARVFSGEAHPNPTFLYESAKVLEGIISIEPEPSALGGRHARAALDLALEVSRLAAKDAEAPILSLQFPVQPPGHTFTGDGTPEEKSAHWPRASSMCMRFSIAIGDVSARERSGLITSMARFCYRFGYGLWVSDSRPEHRSGNWFQICIHNQSRARERIKLPDDTPGQNSSWVLPLTLIGPARVGSTLAALQVLRAASGVGLTGLSITSLDDLAFIHLQLHLPVESGSEFRKAKARIEGLEFPLERPISNSLATLLSAAGATDRSWPDNIMAQLDDRTAGYSLLYGPPLQRQADHKIVRRPIWISWEMESADGGLHNPLMALYAATDQLLEVKGVQRGEQTDGKFRVPLYPNIEYLISRNVGAGTFRAKGKLSAPEPLLKRLFPNEERANWPIRLVTALEGGWLANLDEKQVAPRELTVAWRENWLGRWSSLAG